MELAGGVYKLTETLPKEEMFGLISQIRRAAVSIPSNIAEGHGRLTDRGLKVFLAQARGSLFELETQLQLSRDLGYIESEKVEGFLSQCAEVARMLNGLLAVLKPS
jgi:four helix bundle protein